MRRARKIIGFVVAALLGFIAGTIVAADDDDLSHMRGGRV